MTLCGVLKNILLVLASVLLWGTVIMRIQALGYTIAVAGLIYYSVGYDGILAFYASTSKFGKQIWEGEAPEKKFETASTTRKRGGIARKVIIIGVFTLCVVGLIAGMMVRSGQAQYGEELRRTTRRKGWLDLEGP
jgi:hypothetical protein